MKLEGNCELTVSAREQVAVQQYQSLEQWPMPPLPLPDDSLALKEEEYDEGLPPPQWPSSDNPPMSAAAEEQ